MFQVNEEKDFVIFEKKHISDFSDLKQTISIIPSHCSYKIVQSEELEKILKEEKNTFKISKSFFDEINIENIDFFDINKAKKEKDNTTQIIYFSSSLLSAQHEKDKKLFDKFHNYFKKYSGPSLISDFCFDNKIYFPFSIDDYYIGYDREFSHIFRYHHFYTCFSYGKILHNFGPKGVGKSKCYLSTVFNYLYLKFKELKGKEMFFPAIFFDIKLWINNWNDKNLLLRIIKYEFMNLFDNLHLWKSAYSEYVD